MDATTVTVQPYGSDRAVTLDLAAIYAQFSQIPDQCCRRGICYPLAVLLTIALWATLTGASQMQAISDSRGRYGHRIRAVPEDVGERGAEGIGVRASSLVILRQLFQPFPLFRIMTKNHQPNLLPFHQIKQLVRAGANRFGVRVASIVREVTNKALAEGDSVNRQENHPHFRQPHQHRLVAGNMPTGLDHR